MVLAFGKTEEKKIKKHLNVRIECVDKINKIGEKNGKKLKWEWYTVS